MILAINGMNRETVNLIANAHDAGADVLMTIMLLRSIMSKVADRVSCFEDLYQLSEVARVPTVWTFGKHFGTPIAETPRSYAEWMLKQPDVDPYLVKALRAVVR